MVDYFRQVENKQPISDLHEGLSHRPVYFVLEGRVLANAGVPHVDKVSEDEAEELIESSRDLRRLGGTIAPSAEFDGALRAATSSPPSIRPEKCGSMGSVCLEESSKGGAP